MIIVTGAAGFIGSNLVKALNEQGETNIRIIEDLENGRKMFNLADCRIRDYADRDESLRRMRLGEDVIGTARAVLHQGACSTTTEWNGRYMMETNFEFSQRLLAQCLAKGTPFIYASSASVYGAGKEFRVHPDCERPINMYASSGGTSSMSTISSDSISGSSSGRAYPEFSTLAPDAVRLSTMLRVR